MHVSRNKAFGDPSWGVVMSVILDTSDITHTWLLAATRGHMSSLFGVETKKREESVRKESFRLHMSSWTNGGGVQGGVSDKQEGSKKFHYCMSSEKRARRTDFSLKALGGSSVHFPLFNCLFS